MTDDHSARRLADPDPMGLMDVIELIAPQARVTGWSPLPGGIGNAMHRIEVTMPSGATTAFVLRRRLPGAGPQRDPLQEAATLEGLRGTPVPAPEVLWVDPDGAVFGDPAMATTLLGGDSRSAEAARDPAVPATLAEAAVSLGWVSDLEPFEHLPVIPDARALVAPLTEPPFLTVPWTDTTEVRRTLLAAVDGLAPTQVGLCHGDLHVGNVLFEGTRVSGIVDWDNARLADPRSDVAYAAMDLALCAGTTAADTFLDAWTDLRGPITDHAWWCLWASTTTWRNLDEWLRGWQEAGIDIGLATVHANAAAWTERHLARLTGR